MPIDLERFAQVQVTGYEVKGSEQIAEDKYAQAVEIRLVNVHTQTAGVLIDRQVWRYDPGPRQWWLTTGLPKITQ